MDLQRAAGSWANCGQVPLAEQRGVSWILGLPCGVPLAALPAQEESGLGGLLRLHRKQSAPRLEPVVAEFPASCVWAGRGRQAWLQVFLDFFVFSFAFFLVSDVQT